MHLLKDQRLSDELYSLLSWKEEEEEDVDKCEDEDVILLRSRRPVSSEIRRVGVQVINKTELEKNDVICYDWCGALWSNVRTYLRVAMKI